MLVTVWSLYVLARFSLHCIANVVGIHRIWPKSSLMSDYCESSDEAWEALDYFPDTEMNVSKVVHTEELRNALFPGSLIVINGRTLAKTLRFSVDFTCGQQRNLAKGTIAFHFNPRLQEGYAVRNSLLNGVWGIEETTFLPPFPFRIDAAFELEIYASEAKFIVNVNGRNFCQFPYRISLQTISAIDFVGDVQITHVKISTLSSFSFMRDEFVRRIPLKGPEEVAATEKHQLRLPFLGVLPAILGNGSQIIIRGRVKLLPTSFYVNLQAGKDIDPHPEISLHINPRFNVVTGNNELVKNSFSDGKWQNEERTLGFPFLPGHAFVLSILIEYNVFVIAVDDVIIAEFPTTANTVFANTLYVYGDLFLESVHFAATQRKTLQH